MASAKRETKTSTVDPAALGALIPTEDDKPVSIATLGEEAPPLLRHEPMPPPVTQSMGQVQKARRVAAQAPAPVQPRKDIARMLPSSHRVYVYKKKEDGKQTFVNEYTAQELQGSGTIEAFIKKYVVPHYEHGEYHVHYYDGQSKEPTPLGVVNIEAPVDYVPPVRGNGGVTRQQSTAESLRELMAIQKELSQQAAQPKKTPSEEMMELMMTSMLKKQMEAFSSGDQKENGMGNMLMMMMIMDRMKPPPAPSVDPSVQRLMERMMDRIEAMEQEMRISQSMVPPPPPPPVHEGPSHIEVIIEAMRENSKMMVEAFRSQQVNRDPIKDLADMAALMAPQKNESLTTRDLFELMPKLQTMFSQKDQQKDPFEKVVENFRLFKLMQREFSEDRQHQAPPSEQDSFWSFAKEMIRSDVGKGIAAQIIAQATGQDIARQSRQRVAQQQEEARMVARRRAEQAAQQRQLAEIRAQQAIDRARAIEAAEAAKAQNQSTPQTADQALPSSTSAVTLNEAMPNDSQQQSVEASRTADPSPPAPAPSPPSPPPQDEERSKPLLQAEEHSEQEEEEEDGNEVRVPETFLSVQAKTINEATSDAERIEAIITGFQILATSPDFRPVITKMFGLCKLNRKQEALDHLVEILEFFSDNEVLSPDLPKMARADFDKHWDLIRAHLKFPDVPEVKPNGSADVEAQA